MFEFNPDLMTGDDDEDDADAGVYMMREEDEVSIVLVSFLSCDSKIGRLVGYIALTLRLGTGLNQLRFFMIPRLKTGLGMFSIG